jgi:hypothetical protein
MSIIDSTAKYEKWLAANIPLIAADLEKKHQEMAGGVFPFLRATFYRWAQLWRTICKDLDAAPAVLAVGDLHIENFGTWRDAEGRLAWGVNDFDEAYTMPYTNDLVRLAVSADLAIRDEKLSITLKDACAAILKGYGKGMSGHGCPYVLEERHDWLRAMASGNLRDPERYWKKLDDLKRIDDEVPPASRAVLAAAMPAPVTDVGIAHRIAGLGSLGRERYTMIGDHLGGKVAREIKRLAPSAWIWDTGGDETIHYNAILERAHRVPDPFLSMVDGWALRRLAPDCSRVELDELPRERDEARLLEAMGIETANVHLGSADAVAAVVRDLERRDDAWLRDAAAAMTEATMKDWKEWRSAGS